LIGLPDTLGPPDCDFPPDAPRAAQLIADDSGG
jgi:hypothetical protein